ncbi:hypothetical protein ONZ45_g3316 [Pleurotus djamor]|nr:hypothetical protein ONZ45_g3316 [Pleurotus djamor]
MLIDYNNSEFLPVGERGDQSSEGHRRTGTPGFMSRAVENGGPLPITESFVEAPPIPVAHADYKKLYPDRVRDFPPSHSQDQPQDPKARAWRHDLEHDSESVFWVLFYWLMVARPLGKTPEPIPLHVWSAFVDDWNARHSLISGLISHKSFHSTFGRAVPLLWSLAKVIAPDRSWLSEDDPRNHALYTLEAFQRLVHNFIVANEAQGFMGTPIDVETPRVPDRVYPMA